MQFSSCVLVYVCKTQFTLDAQSLLVLQKAGQLDLKNNYITSPLQFTALTTSVMFVICYLFLVCF